MSGSLGSRAGSKAKPEGSKVAQTQSHASKIGGSDDANSSEVRGRTTPDAEDDQSMRMGSPSTFLREPSPWEHSAPLSGMRPNGILRGGADSAGAAMGGAMGTSSSIGAGPFAGGFGISTRYPLEFPSYTVDDGGDTLSKICKRTSIAPQDLCSLNNLSMASLDMKIAGGTVLKLPAPGQARESLAARPKPEIKAGMLVMVTVGQGQERPGQVVEPPSAPGQPVEVNMLDKWDEDENLRVAASCLREVTDVEMRISVHRWISRMGQWIVKDRNRGADAVLSREESSKLEAQLQVVLKLWGSQKGRPDPALYRLSWSRMEHEMDPSHVLPPVAEHPADEFLKDVTAVIKGLKDAQTLTKNVELSKLEAIQRSASEAVPRKAAAVEALQKELHEAKEAQRIFMEQSYGNDRDPEVMAAFEEMMDAIEAAQREMNEAAFAEQDKAAYDLWEALMTYFDTAQASLADHTGSVIVEEFERLDAQLSAKIAAVAKSKTENPLELNGKPSNFYDDRQKTDSMLSELPEWLEFHVKAIKRALNGQGVHADRVAVLENALLYKCQELRSEFSGTMNCWWSCEGCRMGFTTLLAAHRHEAICMPQPQAADSEVPLPSAPGFNPQDLAIAFYEVMVERCPGAHVPAVVQKGAVRDTSLFSLFMKIFPDPHICAPEDEVDRQIPEDSAEPPLTRDAFNKLGFVLYTEQKNPPEEWVISSFKDCRYINFCDPNMTVGHENLKDTFISCMNLDKETVDKAIKLAAEVGQQQHGYIKPQPNSAQGKKESGKAIASELLGAAAAGKEAVTADGAVKKKRGKMPAGRDKDGNPIPIKLQRQMELEEQIAKGLAVAPSSKPKASRGKKKAQDKTMQEKWADSTMSGEGSLEDVAKEAAGMVGNGGQGEERQMPDASGSVRVPAQSTAEEDATPTAIGGQGAGAAEAVQADEAAALAAPAKDNAPPPEQVEKSSDVAGAKDGDGKGDSQQEQPQKSSPGPDLGLESMDTDDQEQAATGDTAGAVAAAERQEAAGESEETLLEGFQSGGVKEQASSGPAIRDVTDQGPSPTASKTGAADNSVSETDIFGASTINDREGGSVRDAEEDSGSREKEGSGADIHVEEAEEQHAAGGIATGISSHSEWSPGGAEGNAQSKVGNKAEKEERKEREEASKSETESKAAKKRGESEAEQQVESEGSQHERTSSKANGTSAEPSEEVMSPLYGAAKSSVENDAEDAEEKKRGRGRPPKVRQEAKSGGQEQGGKGHGKGKSGGEEHGGKGQGKGKVGSKEKAEEAIDAGQEDEDKRGVDEETGAEVDKEDPRGWIGDEVVEESEKAEVMGGGVGMGGQTGLGEVAGDAEGGCKGPGEGQDAKVVDEGEKGDEDESGEKEEEEAAYKAEGADEDEGGKNGGKQVDDEGDKEEERLVEKKGGDRKAPAKPAKGKKGRGKPSKMAVVASSEDEGDKAGQEAGRGSNHKEKEDKKQGKEKEKEKKKKDGGVEDVEQSECADAVDGIENGLNTDASTARDDGQVAKEAKASGGKKRKSSEGTSAATASAAAAAAEPSGHAGDDAGVDDGASGGGAAMAVDKAASGVPITAGDDGASTDGRKVKKARSSESHGRNTAMTGEGGMGGNASSTDDMYSIVKRGKAAQVPRDDDISDQVRDDGEEIKGKGKAKGRKSVEVDSVGGKGKMRAGGKGKSAGGSEEVMEIENENQKEKEREKEKEKDAAPQDEADGDEKSRDPRQPIHDAHAGQEQAPPRINANMPDDEEAEQRKLAQIAAMVESLSPVKKRAHEEEEEMGEGAAEGVVDGAEGGGAEEGGKEKKKLKKREKEKVKRVEAVAQEEGEEGEEEGEGGSEGDAEDVQHSDKKRKITSRSSLGGGGGSSSSKQPVKQKGSGRSSSVGGGDGGMLEEGRKGGKKDSGAYEGNTGRKSSGRQSEGKDKRDSVSSAKSVGKGKRDSTEGDGKSQSADDRKRESGASIKSVEKGKRQSGVGSKAADSPSIEKTKAGKLSFSEQILETKYKGKVVAKKCGSEWVRGVIRRLIPPDLFSIEYDDKSKDQVKRDEVEKQMADKKHIK